MPRVMRGRVDGVEGRNWELEGRSQGSRRVQGKAVVQRMLKPLRGFALEEQAYIPKPWKEVSRKGSPLQTVCCPSPCFWADRSPEVPLLGSSFPSPDRQAMESVWLAGYVLACVFSSQCVMHLCVCFWVYPATECTHVMHVCMYVHKHSGMRIKGCSCLTTQELGSHTSRLHSLHSLVSRESV